MLRVGMLTSGGDCQALNAALRGVAKTLYASKEDVEIYGFLNGYQGMIYGKYKKLCPSDFSGILTRGGTMLGTSRTPFKELDIPTADGLKKVPAMKQTYKELQLDALVMGGGNGSTKTANRLYEEGLNVIALPKTIDNDTWGTDYTFGFDSAIEIATKCIDDIHTTASSHGRVFVIEIMGHKVGWIPLYAGVAGGADVILLPEIPYDLDKVIKTIEERDAAGSRFTIIAAAEGAITKKQAAMKKKDYKALLAQRKGSVVRAPWSTRSPTRSTPPPAARSVSPSPVTPSAVASRAPATACSPRRSASRLPRASSRASSASWLLTRVARSCASR